ncbi:hypothetical protein ES703_82637 [subsurface metagenome]
MVDKIAELAELLQGMSIDKLRLLLHFIDFLKQTEAASKSR